MSLINQVLKDLEKRHASADAGVLTRAVRPLPGERRSRSLWIALGVTAIALASGAGWWTMHGTSAFALRIPSDTTGSKVPLAPAAQTAAETNTQPAVASAQVKPDAAAGASPAPVAPVHNGTPAPASAAGSVDQNPVPPTATSPALATASEPKGAPAAPVAGAARVARVEAEKKRDTMSVAAATVPVASSPVAAATESAITGKETERAASMLQTNDSEAAPAARPRASIARARQHLAPETAPRISATAQSVEYPDAKSASSDANIEKQVRPPSNRERAEASFRQGMNLVQNGDAAGAELPLREALSYDPLLDKARQALLGLYVEAGRRDDAERLLDERLRIDPKHFGFAMALARLQLDRGTNGDALATLQRSLPYGESSADYQAMLANALSRVARHKEAAERYDAAARIAPRNPLWQMGLGMELRADNRSAEARAAFQHARALGGLNAQLTSYLDQQLRELQ